MNVESMDTEKPSPFADLLFGLFWFVLAVAIMIGSWTMDRLVHLKVSLYTAPGVVPGLLGVALAIMAVLMIARAVRAGAVQAAHWPELRLQSHWRILTSLTLCLLFAIGAVGSGLPFWAAAATFVAVFVFVFRFEELRSEGRLLRGSVVAAVYGLISGAAIHYVFQELFLVRLP
jgi:hypothetical protein